MIKKAFLISFSFLLLDSLKAQSQIDTIDIQWITTHLAKRPTDSLANFQQGNPISYFMPSKFEAYAKILHPFSIDLDKTDEIWNEKEAEERYKEKSKLDLIKLFSLPDSLKSQNYDTVNDYFMLYLAKKHHFNRDTLDKISINKPPNESAKGDFLKYKEVILGENMKLFFKEVSENDRIFEDNSKVKNTRFATWREVCEKYNFQFHNQLNYNTFYKKFEATGYPPNLYLPDIELPKAHLDMLLEFIKKISKSKQLYYQLSDTQAIPILVESLLNEYEGHFSIKGGYIFDSSKTWLIHSDPRRDLEITLFAGTKSMMKQLKKSGLEIIECSPETRVDWRADSLNK